MRIGTLCACSCLAGALLGAWIGAARANGAADSTGNPPAWLDEIRFNAFLSASYSYNFNKPPSRTNQFRVFDFDDNTFKLDEFELVAQKPAAKPRDAGFRVDLTLGSSVPQVTASAGLFRDDSGQAGDIDIHQAFATYLAPLGSGLRFDVGKFITPFGYEVIDGYDNWNDNATRSVLFGYAIPFTHVGIRSSYAFSPRVSALAMLVNGWDVAVDNNRGKSVGAQITLTPSSPVTISLTGMFGPERTDNNSDPRTLLDVVAIFRTSSRVTLGGNFDWGSDQDALGPGRDGRWSGFAGYTRLSMTGAFAISLRGEYFNDRDGVRTGVIQELTEVTVTPELRLSPHMLLRGDARVDHSNHTVFEKAKGPADTQPTAFLQAICSF
jgi:hypothetical protein